jgi:hypothetical protein
MKANYVCTDFDKAYDLYKSGLSVQRVARNFGITRQSLFKSFKLRGFALRSPIPRPFKMYDGNKFTRRKDGYYRLSNKGRDLMHRYVWEKEVGIIPEGWDIHHIDEDKSNNVVSNFECLPKSEHTRKYSPHNNQFTKGRKRCTT